MLQRRRVRSPTAEQGCGLIVRLDMGRVFYKQVVIRSQSVVQSTGPLNMLLIQTPEVEVCIRKTRSQGNRFPETCLGPFELPFLCLDNPAKIEQAWI